MALEEEDIPAINTTTAICILVFYTVIYVAPFYISSTTRPSTQLSRDAPSNIKGRIQSVTLSCIICALITYAFLWSNNGAGEAPLGALHSMGFFPIGLIEAAKCTILTCILFLGPLFETAIIEGAWKDWVKLHAFKETFGSWIGYRNLIAGPITEEILFRSCAIPLFILSRASPSTIIFLTPLIFGLAHIHHFYEFRITHPHNPLLASITRSLFQLSYTTLFGAYATFLYLRTGSLLAVVLAHSFCNFMGLPRVWGRVRGAGTLMEPDVGRAGLKRDEDHKPHVLVADERLSFSWTIVYYVLLVTGTVCFWSALWRLTESRSALVKL
ncbi:MAG: hypothetical protein M1818_000291 [Claussenomyces sp. TS43310]|nr:MAG: hypothetical protein M1818_000291 [Claussenomyces sp. TS43310]